MINIVYDHELTGSEIPMSKKLSMILYMFRNFIYERIKILEDEINAESGGAIVINVFNTLRTKQGNLVPKGIHYQLFSEKLKDKLLNCFTQEDEIYIAHEISAALAELN